MTRTKLLRQVILFVIPILLIGTTTALAQNKTGNGILKIHVNPKQAYVFVDDTAISDGSQAITLDAGRHTVEVRNYGYAPQTQPVEITSGKKTELTVTLQPSGRQGGGSLRRYRTEGPSTGGGFAQWEHTCIFRRPC
jgi:hypothetical protein